jgi:hypothetical protein
MEHNMDNLWPADFQEVEVVKPLDIIKKQADYLSTITNKMVYGEVEDSEGLEFIEGGFGFYSFNYRFLIKSKYVDKYSFRVLSFAHDIPIYPAIILLNDNIKKELDFNSRAVKSDNSESLTNLLKDILHTKKLREVVGSLITLSKDYKE